MRVERAAAGGVVSVHGRDCAARRTVQSSAVYISLQPGNKAKRTLALAFVRLRWHSPGNAGEVVVSAKALTFSPSSRTVARLGYRFFSSLICCCGKRPGEQSMSEVSPVRRSRLAGDSCADVRDRRQAGSYSILCLAARYTEDSAALWCTAHPTQCRNARVDHASPIHRFGGCKKRHPPYATLPALRVIAKAFAFALWLSWGDLQSNACAGKSTPARTMDDDPTIAVRPARQEAFSAVFRDAIARRLQ
ncbi:hypothetical protein PSEUDO8O_30603 [Pseudomonas sp. 8O]|nr:hypothetical protein PSEUDO8O_30603 [Pseudomonas sp. 8O]